MTGDVACVEGEGIADELDGDEDIVVAELRSIAELSVDHGGAAAGPEDDAGTAAGATDEPTGGRIDAGARGRIAGSTAADAAIPDEPPPSGGQETETKDSEGPGRAGGASDGCAAS